MRITSCYSYRVKHCLCIIIIRLCKELPLLLEDQASKLLAVGYIYTQHVKRVMYPFGGCFGKEKNLRCKYMLG